MNDTVFDNTGKQRFELELAGQIVFAHYRREDDRLVIPYVEAPPALRGTGAASKLLHGVMEIAREEKRKVVPLCSYAAAWMRGHQEYTDLLA
jgi:predicted GNAT family acetyltransferase